MRQKRLLDVISLASHDSDCVVSLCLFVQALALWPRNAELLAMLAEAGEAARATARLRRDLTAAREVRRCDGHAEHCPASL